MIGQAFIFGLICFQIIYVIMQWYFFKRIEFLYYIVYLVLFVLYQYAYYEPRLGFTNMFDGSVENIKLFTRIIGLLIFYSYVVFSRYFTEAKSTNKSMNIAMKNLEKYLLIGFFSEIIFAYFVSKPGYGEMFSWIFYIPSFIYGIVIGVRLINQRVRLNTYIIIGSLFAICGAFAQGIADDFGFFFGNAHHKSNTIMELGFVAEFVFLNIGFMYKNKLIQQEQIDANAKVLQATIEKNEIANQLQEVRAKLAMDLHDDINSSLGSIRIVSEIMTKQLTLEKDKNTAQKILDTIQELSHKMHVIVWSIIETNDTLQNFIEYTKDYADSYAEATGLDCKVTAHFETGTQTINGNIRKNLFMCIKEVLNNTLKYAQATHVSIAIQANKNGTIHITIADNGIGITATNKYGNGLSNMKKRMQSINGTFELTSVNGTKVILICNHL